MAGRTVRNGYGEAHRKERLRLAPKVAAGEAVCWRCQKPIKPYQPWDLGHHDYNRAITMGAEHRRCNRAVKSHRAARNTKRAKALRFFD